MKLEYIQFGIYSNFNYILYNCIINKNINKIQGGFKK